VNNSIRKGVGIVFDQVLTLPLSSIFYNIGANRRGERVREKREIERERKNYVCREREIDK